MHTLESFPTDLAFGRLRVLVDRRELLVNGVRIKLGSRAFAILMLLIEACGEVVSKGELMSRVWDGTIVEENTLQSQIWALRNALGQERDLILTVSGRGYRFVGQFQEAERRQVAVAVAPDPKRAGRSRGRVLATSTRTLTNLPWPVSPLIGRSSDLAKLATLTVRRRLVTLTGTGGIGKTRLALELVHRLLPHFPDGVWWTELAPVADPQLIGAAVVAALGLQISAPELSIAGIAAALGTRRMLLVLDNCEHVIDVAASFIEGLLRATPSLQIVTTSREPLGAPGEQVYRVSPLEIPPEGARGVNEVLAYESAQFFCTRVQEAEHAVSLDDGSAEAVAAICRRLDGLPLALELAASRAAAVGIATVVTGLDRSFELLCLDRRTSPPRHRTLRATLDWSYGLLSEDERRVLCRLAVFSGGFTLEAACTLAVEDGADTTTVVGCVARLLAKSFIAADRKEPTVRYRLLETTRAYALERLAESDDTQAMRRRHAEYFRDLLEAAARDDFAGSSGLESLVLELDNVRAALAWTFAAPGDPWLGVGLAVHSAPLWLGMSLLNECRSWMEKAVSHLGAGGSAGKRDEVVLRSTLAMTLTIQGAATDDILTALGSAPEQAAVLLEKDYQVNALHVQWFAQVEVGAMYATACRIESVIAQMGSERLIGFAQRIIGTTEYLAGDLRNARLHLARSIEGAERLSRRIHAARFAYDNRAAALSALASTLWLQGLPDQAVVTAERSLDEARAAGNVIALCSALLHSLFLALKVEDLEAAGRYATELSTCAEEVSSDIYRSYALAARGVLIARCGESEPGLALLQAALQTFRLLEHAFFCTVFRAETAVILGKIGRLQESHAVLDELLRQVQRGGVSFFLPELLRVKGELESLADTVGSTGAAEATLIQSIDWARRQGALSWELRATMTLAQLMRRQGRDTEAIEALAPVYARFEEGFNTKDLKLAKRLLEQLGVAASGHRNQRCRC